MIKEPKTIKGVVHNLKELAEEIKIIEQHPYDWWKHLPKERNIFNKKGTNNAN